MGKIEFPPSLPETAKQHGMEGGVPNNRASRKQEKSMSLHESAKAGFILPSIVSTSSDSSESNPSENNGLILSPIVSTSSDSCESNPSESSENSKAEDDRCMRKVKENISTEENNGSLKIYNRNTLLRIYQKTKEEHTNTIIQTHTQKTF